MQVETVLVTGAAGFIGSHVVRQLAANPVLSIIAATRDGRNGTRRLDVCHPGSIRAALAGVTAVVHCAVGDRAVTVAGTAALLAAAAEARVRRVVYLSSVGVYGSATGAVTEATAMVSATGPGYPAWKAAAELACLGQPGVEIVRLRPAIVYGPGSRLWIAQLARRIQSGHWGVFGAAGEGTCNPVYVGDVVSAVTLALHAEHAAGAAFNINGAETMTWNAWFAALAQAIGAPPLRPVSPAALQRRSAMALPIKAAARLAPGLAPAFVSRWLLGAPAASERRLYALRATYPTDAAQAALGWAPRTGTAEGLAHSAAWLREAASVGAARH